MPRRRTPGTIRRRGSGYRIRVQVDGKRRVFTVATSDKRVAEAYAIRAAKDLQAEVEQRVGAAINGIRMSALFDRFESTELRGLAIGTQDAYRDSLKPFRRYWSEQGDPTVDSIQMKHIDEYLTWRRVNRTGSPAPLGAHTLRKDRAVLHRIFAKAERYGYRVGNPVTATEKPKADQRDPLILTDDQYDSLLSACGDREMLRLFVLTLGEAGVRSESEALMLTWDDVRLDDGFLYISQRNGRRVKGGKARWTPMTERLVGAMRDHFAQYRFAAYAGTQTPWVFHHPRTALRFTAGERIGSLYDGFKRAAARAKLPPNLRPHDLRHRRITKWLGEGQSATLVKEAVGHADLRTTMGYTHLSKEHLRALVAPATPQLVARARTGT